MAAEVEGQHHLPQRASLEIPLGMLPELTSTRAEAFIDPHQAFAAWEREKDVNVAGGGVG